MITIVTGHINAGKTSYLFDLYEKGPRGDGFLSMKYYENKSFRGYDLLHLKTFQRTPFVRVIDNLPNNWHEIYRLNQFSFSGEAFQYANSLLPKMFDFPIFIDEIGPLEIHQNKGFYKPLKKMLDRELIITVRRSLYEDFLKTFDITQKINKIEID